MTDPARDLHAELSARQIARDSAMATDAGDIRIVHNKLLGGWYVVRGPHQAPLNGRFGSKEEAQAWLASRGGRDQALATDPPVSEPQRRAMQAAAHGKSTLGIPKSVGEEFVGKAHDAAEIKRMSSNEANVSQRHVTYDLYLDGRYLRTYHDINHAIAERDRLNYARGTNAHDAEECTADDDYEAKGNMHGHLLKATAPVGTSKDARELSPGEKRYLANQPRGQRSTGVTISGGEETEQTAAELGWRTPVRPPARGQAHDGSGRFGGRPAADAGGIRNVSAAKLRQMIRDGEWEADVDIEPAIRNHRHIPVRTWKGDKFYVITSGD